MIGWVDGWVDGLFSFLLCKSGPPISNCIFSCSAVAVNDELRQAYATYTAAIGDAASPMPFEDFVVHRGTFCFEDSVFEGMLDV